jgi:diguanylate cyclase
MQASNEQMRARIVELEAKANQLNDQLKDEQRLSSVDALTNIPNRLAYEQRLGEELERWKRFKQPTCLAVFDVDHFKRINDTYGHRAGDRVLRAVADRLAARIRRTDFIARYGGEEFVLLLPGTPIQNALGLLEDLRRSIASVGFHYRGTPIAITVSGGVTEFTPNDTAARAFDRADKALYQAKQNGRNRVEKAE